MIKQQLRKVRTLRKVGRTLRKVARTMATWPIVGRFVRIGVAVIRLPEFRAAYLDSNHRQHVFETEQLPRLLQTVSDLNHPVALRKITRDLIEIRGQLETVSSSVDYLLGRVEFVRRELMFEMRYGAKAPNSDTEQIKTKVEIVNPGKLADARNERMRLNLGCGHIALEGYLNVDRRALPGVDIVAEVDELPFELGEVDEILSAHLLEHFPQEQLRRELLPYWYSLLKEDGIFRAVVPDADAMIQNYTKGEYPYDDMREVMYGTQDYDGDFHFNMFTPESMKKLLQEAGFTAVHIHAVGRPNGKCFELEVSAKSKGK